MANSVMEQPGILFDKRDPELLRCLKNHLVVLTPGWSCNVLYPRSPGSKHVIDEGKLLYVVSSRSKSFNIIRQRKNIRKHH